MAPSSELMYLKTCSIHGGKKEKGGGEKKRKEEGGGLSSFSKSSCKVLLPIGGHSRNLPDAMRSSLTLSRHSGLEKRGEKGEERGKRRKAAPTRMHLGDSCAC